MFRLDNAVLAFRFTATVFDRAGAASERLTNPGRLGLWLQANGLSFSGEPSTEEELAAATELRETIHRAGAQVAGGGRICLLYTSPSPRDLSTSRMPSSA